MPSPPRVMPANISSSRLKPLLNATCSLRAKSTPPRAASAPPSAHTNGMTRSTSMPDEAARSGLSATARMALPILVRCRTKATQHEHDDGDDDDPEVLRRAMRTGPTSIAVLDLRSRCTAADRRTEEELEEVADAAATGRSTRPSSAAGSCPGAGAVARARGRAARRRAPPTTMARTVAGMRWIAQSTLTYQAMIAPKVTSSPWAKLVSPVVPKMSDSPTAGWR